MNSHSQPELILLTNYYPYDRGEEYLESEIGILSQTFTSVTVIPLMTTQASSQTRALPAGVRVLNPTLGRSTTGRAVDLGSSLLRRSRGPLLTSNFSVRNPERWVFDRYFSSRVESALKRLLGMEPQFTPQPGRSVVIYSYWFYLTAAVGAALKQRWQDTNRVALVSRGHGYDVNIKASAVNYLPAREALLECVDQLHPVSEATTKYFRETYPRFADKVSTRRLGSKSHSYVNVATQSPLHVVTVSTIRPLKRLEVVGGAIKLLRQSIPHVRWTHIGSGAGKDGTEFTNHWTRELGHNSVEFMGHLSNDDLHEWFQNHEASVFINVSSSEGVPVSIMEAMSYGLPIIATDVGGTRELFTTEMLGGLLPADVTAEMVANTVRELAYLPSDQYQLLAQSSRASWESHWHAERNYVEFAKELLSLPDDAP